MITIDEFIENNKGVIKGYVCMDSNGKWWLCSKEPKTCLDHWYQTVQNEDIGKLRGLLKKCQLSTFKIYDRLRFSDENEITPADLINAVEGIKPMLWGILNSINAALGESEEKW